MASSKVAQSNQVADALSDFSWELYSSICKDPSCNIFFSPFSLMTALSMVYAGAKGDTAEQMSAVLRLSKIAGDDVHKAFQNLNHVILKPNASYTLKTANRLYAQRDYNILKPFSKKTKSNYKASLKSVDFVSAAEDVRSLINRWVSEQTNGKISDLIPSGAFDSLTRLVLVNAIYFKGNWLKQFNPQQTNIEQFYVSNSESVPVQMMYMIEPASYYLYEDQSVKSQVLSLPYVDDKLSMLVVLPDPSVSLTDVEKISADVLWLWMRRISIQTTKIHLPRFKLEESFTLNDHLSGIGMGDIFSPEKADLSGITGNKDLSVSQVFHKAFIEVNEEGTEAAAATATDDMIGSTSERRNLIPTFRADRPFLFLIQHNVSGSILFLGRVVRPG